MNGLRKFFKVVTFIFLTVNILILLFGLKREESFSALEFFCFMFVLINTLHVYNFLCHKKVNFGYAIWDFTGAVKDYFVLSLIVFFWLILTVILFMTIVV